MASDLLELTRMLYGAEPAARESVQKSIRGGIENAALYDELEATRGLRQLLRENPQAGVEQIAAYRPELALKYPDFQFKAQKTLTDINKNLAGTAKTQQEMQQTVMKQQAQAIVPLIDKFHMSMDSGMPEQQARQQFFIDVGRTAPILEQMGIGFGQPLNDKIHSPESLEYVAAGSGVYTNRLKADQEEAAAFGAQSGRMAAGVQPTPAQALGEVVMVDGYPTFKPPVPGLGGGYGGGMGGGMPAPQTGGGQMADFTKMSDKALATIASKGLPEERPLATAEINRRAGAVGGAGGLYTPEQAATLKQEKDVETAGQKKSAEMKAAEEQEVQKSLESYMGMRSPKELESIISQSLTSPTEVLLNKLANYMGVSIPGGEQTAALNTIVQQLASGIANSPGPQSDADLRAKLLQVGDAASGTPAGERLQPLGEYLRLMRDRIVTKSKPTPDQIRKMIGEGKISKEEAKQISNRMSGKVKTPEPSDYDALVSELDATKPKAESQQYSDMPTAPSAKPKQLRIGDIVSGHEYLGGDPKNPASWRK
jgi:hypothetical protein